MAKAAALTPDLEYFNPMIYDIMRETATELRGAYIWLSRHAGTAEERDAAASAHIALWQDVNSIPGSDRELIEAKTAEYRSRLNQLRAAA